MINWFEELGSRSKFQKYGVWFLALLLSLVFNWTAAEQLSRQFLETYYEPRDNKDKSLEVTVDPSFHRFVEANPNVPINEPDPTPNFAARDQQAAQESSDIASDSHLPELDAEQESQTIMERGDEAHLEQGIYSDHVADEVPAQQEAGMGTPFPEAAQELPEWLQEVVADEGDSVPEIRTTSEDTPEDAKEERTGWIALDDGPAPEEADPQEAPQEFSPEARPMPRPRVGADVLQAPLNRSGQSASRQGRIAVESKMTDFGDYTQRALEAIQAEWHRLVREVSPSSSASFTKVRVRFDVLSNGEIENMAIEESTAGELAAMICLDAIHARAPYGHWTDDMKSTLGDRTTMRITFNYY